MLFRSLAPSYLRRRVREPGLAHFRRSTGLCGHEGDRDPVPFLLAALLAREQSDGVSNKDQRHYSEIDTTCRGTLHPSARRGRYRNTISGQQCCLIPTSQMPQHRPSWRQSHRPSRRGPRSGRTGRRLPEFRNSSRRGKMWNRSRFPTTLRSTGNH